MRNRIHKKLMSVLLAMAMAISLLPAVTLPASAEYTATDTMTSLYNSNNEPVDGDCYSISDETELEYLSEYVADRRNTENVTFYLTANIDLNEGVTFTFDADTGLVEVSKQGETTYWLGTGTKGDVSGGNATFDTAASTPGAVYANDDSITTGGVTVTLNSWMPIGSDEEHPFFVGTFDGGGFTVSGVYINGNSDYQGLFGYMYCAAVQNVGVVNSYIIGHNDVGGVVGYDYRSTVRYCHNTGSVIGTGRNVGGVVGYSYNNSKVWYCHNTGSVIGTDSGDDNIGGVAGYNDGSKIQYSYNTGDVTGSCNYVGGVAGCNDEGTIQYSYNMGDVTGGNICVGGVAGYNYADESPATVQYCYNTGDVTGYSVNYVGGVVGLNFNGGTATGCYYNNDNCTVVNGIGSITGNGDNVAGSAEGKSTSDLQSVTLETGISGDGWTAAHWIFADSVYPQHTGATADTAYEISTAEQLAYLAQQVSEGTDFSGIYFRQTADIDLNEGVTFTLDADTGLVEVSKQGETTFWLGTGAKGDGSGENTTFDTAAGTAGSVYTDDTSTATGTAAFSLNSWTPIGLGAGYDDLFCGDFNGGIYKIYGAYINTVSRCQGLFGTLGADGTIENVKVENSYIAGEWSTGGVVGYNYMGTVQNCCNEGTVIGSGDIAGGVVGCNYEDSAILYCCNTGAVTGSGYDVGGVAGANSGDVTNCYNTGAVTGSNNYVGGVAGNNSGDITSCYNTGAVTGDDYNYNVGGVAGYNDSGTVQYCYNAGNVEGNYTAGGVAGCNYQGTIQYSYNTGAVIASNDDFSHSTAGGVAGYNDSGTVRYCYNAGSIYDNSYGDDGAVAGYNHSGTVENCCYDNQIYPWGGIYWDDPIGVVGKSTSEMVGTGLSALLGTAGNWVFTTESSAEDNLYPRLSGMESTNAAKLSASPVFLANSEAAYTVESGFNVSTVNGVAWASLDNGIISVTNGAATVTDSGTVYLKASINDSGSTISRTVFLYVPSKDATLSYVQVKDQTVTDPGTPSGTLGSETPGAVTITPAQAADEEGDYSTRFYANHDYARVKEVKYASGADTSSFASDEEYDDEAISDGDFFVVRVTAEDEVTVNYYKIVVTVGGAADLWDDTTDTDWYYNDTSAASFTINTAEELAGLAYIVNSGIDDFSGDTITLAADLDLNKLQWTPIGSSTINSDIYFKGTFNGGGHTISNLAIGTAESPHTTYNSIGLFGKTFDATVTNVGLKDVLIYAGSNVSYVGGLVGNGNTTYLQQSNLSNCYVTGHISCQGGIYIGGLAGMLSRTNVSNCYTTGSVAVASAAYAGGLLGSAQMDGTISDCYSTSSVSTGDGVATVAGGLIGALFNVTSVTNCYATGNTACGTGTMYHFAGGFIGYNSGSQTFSGCYYNSSATQTAGGEQQTATGVGSGTDEITAKASAYMKSTDFVADLNGESSSWASDTGTKNQGYPVLSAVNAVPSTLYRVTYDGNGSTGGFAPMDTGAYPGGTSAVLAADTGALSKSGYTFGGWNTQADGAGTGYDVCAAYTISGNVTLYAKWTSQSSGGGGSSVSRTITVTETSSKLFKDSQGTVKAEANVNNAFSSSVEVKVTDTEEDGSGFGLGAGNKVYPFNISLYIKGTQTKTEPKDGYAVTISLPIPDELLDVKDQLSIVHKPDGGSVETLASQLKQINGVWYLVFKATEFSPYALVANDAASYDETAGLPYYVDSEGNLVFIGFAANGKYVASSGVTVLFKKNAKTFADTGSHWAESGIDFVTERELFAGTGSNTFSPDTGMTRAMFATVIGRLYERSYGEIKNADTHSFTDCNYDNYYGKYIDWAAEEGIIGGYGNGKFGPNNQISREQMAAILYRFADFLGVIPAAIDSTLNYPDAGDISSWAENAALYCQSTGIIMGRGEGNFAPRGTATRAEAAVILERFIENVLD